MRTRKQGRYTSHCSPGDGTGLDEIPGLDDPGDVFDDTTDPAAQVGKLSYDPMRMAPVSGGKGRKKGRGV